MLLWEFYTVTSPKLEWPIWGLLLRSHFERKAGLLKLADDEMAPVKAEEKSLLREIPWRGFFRSGCDWEHMAETLLERHYRVVIWEMTLSVDSLCAESICCAVISLPLFFPSHETCLCYQGQQQNASLRQIVPSFTWVLQWWSQFLQKFSSYCSYFYYYEIIIHHGIFFKLCQNHCFRMCVLFSFFVFV